MNVTVLLVCMSLMVIAAFALGRARSLRLAPASELNSLPHFYGILTAMWAMVPAIILLIAWVVFEEPIIQHFVLQHLPEETKPSSPQELNLLLSQVYNIAYDDSAGLAPSFMLSAAQAVVSLEQKSLWLRSTLIGFSMLMATIIMLVVIRPSFGAQKQIEKVFKTLLICCSFVAVLTTLGIFFSVLFESIRFFQLVPITDFLFGLEWSPQGSFHEEQTLSESRFGAIPLFLGTILIAVLAMFVAVPIGLYSAVYLSEYASPRFRSVVKPTLEVLAGVPTVVYGFFAALTVAPFVRDIALAIGLDRWLTVSSESALAAGLVMGLMTVPFISSLSDDAMRLVPRTLRDGSLALGATQAETVKKVVLPAASPSILSGILLAASRAVGETMIVVMAAGLAAKMTMNPLDSLTTVTVQMVTSLVGDQEFDSPKMLSAFALGLMLFLVTLSLNFCALSLVKRFGRAHA